MPVESIGTTQLNRQIHLIRRIGGHDLEFFQRELLPPLILRTEQQNRSRFLRVSGSRTVSNHAIEDFDRFVGLALQRQNLGLAFLKRELLSGMSLQPLIQ